MSKTSKVLLTVLILSSIAIVYSSFGTPPQIHLWNWFGYKFGISINSNSIVFKIIAVLSMAGLVYESHRNEKKTLA